MNIISTQVPTSIEELSELGILGENVVKEYGERLIKNINAFVDKAKLQKYIDKHRASAKTKKRPRVTGSSKSPQKASTAPIVVDMTDDEFDNGIDFSAIELPSSSTTPTPTALSQTNSGKAHKKSAYFKGVASKKLSKYGNT